MVLKLPNRRLGLFLQAGIAAGILVAAVLAGAAQISPPAPASGPPTAPAKITFPEGTATPSEVCGACHKALYQEFARGAGSDLHWGPMKFAKSSKGTLALPPGASNSATAHAMAGSDPWPIEAKRVEEHDKECNVCHFPQPFAYPDIVAEKIEKARPREANRVAGITCASCHLTPEGKIRGPYQVDAPHETVADPRVQTSAACAMCHAEGERVVGKQTQTFLEWREDFNKPGLGAQQCQDCHMPKTSRKLAEDFPVPERAVARHLWTGGHSFKRVAAALNLSIAQAGDGQPQFALHVANVGAGHSVPTGSNRRAVYLDAEVVNTAGKVVARNSWMFAPWMLGRPDDRKFIAEDLKGGDPIATSQADAQGPHETIIRAGEDRVLSWNPAVPRGQYTVRATLTYDLNRYNDRNFKNDQYEIGKASIGVKINAPVNLAASRVHASR